MNGEDLESDLSYFDISDFNTSFPKSKLNGTNFFNIKILFLCYNFDDLHNLLASYPFS